MRIVSKVILLLTTLTMSSTYAMSLPKPPDAKSESYTVLDFQTGKTLLSKNENEVLSPASVTKLMTTYVVLKEMKRGIISMDDTVKISSNAVLTAKKSDSSRTFLEIGDVVPIKDVLKGLIVQSGNDAAIALAEHVAGRESSFAELMTSYAKELGMKNSSFKNASGLPAKNHYTTSHDLSLLMKALITEFPDEYAYFFSIKSFTYNSIKQNSRNKLLFSNDEFEGGKTGWHTTAKYCYVASVMKNGRRLIISSLKAPKANDRFNDAIALTNYGYRYYENYTIVKKDTPIEGLSKLPIFLSEKTNVKIVPDSDIVFTLKRGEFEKTNAVIELHDKVIAPAKKGDIVGSIKVYLDEQQLGESNIVLAEEVKEGTWIDVLMDTIAVKFFD